MILEAHEAVFVAATVVAAVAAMLLSLRRGLK